MEKNNRIVAKAISVMLIATGGYFLLSASHIIAGIFLIICGILWQSPKVISMFDVDDDDDYEYNDHEDNEKSPKIIPFPKKVDYDQD